MAATDELTEAELKKQFEELYMTMLKYMEDFVSLPTQRYHLSFEAFKVLELIGHGKEVTLMTLAEDMGVSKSAIARHVGTLLTEDYVIQKESPRDRRVKFITLTARGNRVRRNATDDLKQRFHRWVGFLGGKEAVDQLIQDVYRADQRARAAGFVETDNLRKQA